VILAAEDRHYPTPDHPEHTPPETVVHRFWRHKLGEVSAPQVGQPKGEWPAGVHDTVAAVAYVNHGRWVVDCPFGCGSAQMASRSDRRFFCVECGHRGDGRWLPVVWPSDLEVQTVEAVLDARPDMATRNWRPGEPIDALVAENAGHGLAPA
jgi:hypothetical protein